jgi:hypothetical protein
MALLSFGFDTPSLLAQGEQRLPLIFNIQRGNALFTPAVCGAEISSLLSYRFHKAGSRGAWRKRFAEILRLMGNLAVPEFHYAYRMERLPVVSEDVFGNPQIASPQNAPDFEALLTRLLCAACLNVGPPANPLPRLRIVENGVLAINLMLGRKIVCVGRRPMLDERCANVLI